MPVGDELGRAILLDFPTYDTPETRIPRGQGTSGSAGGQDVSKIVPMREGIQLDAAGMEKLYYDAVSGLRQFVQENLRNGIDVTGAPNLSDPRSVEANELFRDAMSQVNLLGERLVQGRDMQKDIQEAYLSNKAFASPRFQQPGGIIESGDLPDLAFSQKPQLVDNANKVLSITPKTPQENKELEEFYYQTLGSIDQLVEENKIAPEAAAAWRNMIKPPARLDEEMRNAKLNSEKARANASWARAAATRKAAAKGDGPTQLINPAIRAIADFVSGQGNRKVGAGALFDDEFFRGASLHDEKNFIYDELRQSPDGGYTMVFKKTTTNNQGRVKGEETKFVHFNEDNILAPYMETLSNTQKDAFLKKLEKSGLGDEMSAEEYLKHVGGMGEGDELGLFSDKEDELGLFNP